MCLEICAPSDFIFIGLKAPQSIMQCVMCQAPTPTTLLTTGAQSIGGNQAFACNEHAYNKAKWLLFWAKYKTKQQIPSEAIPPRYYEHRALRTVTELATEVAQHLQVRHELGKTVVVVDRPAIFLSLVRKQWMKLSRVIQLQRASTLDIDLIKEFSQEITTMMTTQFAAKPLDKAPKNTGVYILSPNELQMLPSDCKNIYLCTKLSDYAMQRLAQHWQPGTIMVEWCASADN